MIAELQSELWNREIQHAEKQMEHGLFMTPQYDLPSSTMTVNYYGFKKQYDEHWFILLFLLSLHLWLSDTVGPTLKKLERYHLQWGILHLFSLQVSFPPWYSLCLFYPPGSPLLWDSFMLSEHLASLSISLRRIQYDPEKRIGTSSKFNQFYFTFSFEDTNMDVCHDEQITLYKRTLNWLGLPRD